MAKSPSRDRIVGMFDRGAQEKRIERILDRAVEKRVAASARAFGVRQPKLKGMAKKAGKTGGRALRKALAGALKTSLERHGPAAKGSGRPSTRQTAPDSGGRAFHFQYYSVSKGAGFKPASGGGAKGSTGPGAASAHHAYIEREAALEAMDLQADMEAGLALATGRTFAEEQAIQEAGRGTAAGRERVAEADVERGPEAGRARKRPRDKHVGPARERDGRGRERETDGHVHDVEAPGAARAAQAYIENPVKLRTGESVLNTFGNIGDTYEERLAFWDLLEEHEPHPDARIQNRIICELPHQSTPAARAAILREFMKPHDEKGLPYHVAVHAPGPDNDSRNFHAHIVFAERPAKKMWNVASGRLEWDFAITVRTRDSSRHWNTSHPHRQDKLRELGGKNYVFGERKRFAECVTKVMADVDPAVRFDPRSYADMGLDVTPMRSVRRILRDRIDKGRTVVQDAGWTRRMIDAELAAAAQRRDADMAKLLDLTRKAEALRKDWPNVAKANRHLGPRERVGAVHGLTKAVVKTLTERRLAAEMERMQARVMARTNAAVCERVIAATDPAVNAAALRDRDPLAAASRARLTDGLDPAAVAAIHAAAKEELASVRADLARTETKVAKAVEAVSRSWRAKSAQPTPPGLANPAADPPAKRAQAQRTTAGGPAAAEAAAKRPAQARRDPPSAGPAEGKTGKARPPTGGRAASDASTAKPRRVMPGPVPPTPQPEESSRAKAARELLEAISKMMSSMYDTSLSAAAFVADLDAKHGFGITAADATAGKEAATSGPAPDRTSRTTGSAAAIPDPAAGRTGERPAATTNEPRHVAATTPAQAIPARTAGGRSGRVAPVTREGRSGPPSSPHAQTTSARGPASSGPIAGVTAPGRPSAQEDVAATNRTAADGADRRPPPTSAVGRSRQAPARREAPDDATAGRLAASQVLRRSTTTRGKPPPAVPQGEAAGEAAARASSTGSTDEPVRKAATPPAVAAAGGPTRHPPKTRADAGDVRPGAVPDDVRPRPGATKASTRGDGPRTENAPETEEARRGRIRKEKRRAAFRNQGRGR